MVFCSGKEGGREVREGGRKGEKGGRNEQVMTDKIRKEEKEEEKGRKTDAFCQPYKPTRGGGGTRDRSSRG